MQAITARATSWASIARLRGIAVAAMTRISARIVAKGPCTLDCHAALSNPVQCAGNVGEERIEPVGGLVLHPMPCSRDDLEASVWLDAAQHMRALLEVGIGCGVAFAPDTVDLCLHKWERSGKRIGAREPAAFDPAARRVLRLDIDRQLVDFCRVG